MPRLMSVALTEQAVREQRKTVTRRLGWTFLQPGDRITLCRKVMGRRKGEPLVRICDVEIVSVRRERLDAITPQDVAREGFVNCSPTEFVRFFGDHMRCEPHVIVTRIEWRYLAGPSCALCGKPVERSSASDGWRHALVEDYHGPCWWGKPNTPQDESS